MTNYRPIESLYSIVQLHKLCTQRLCMIYPLTLGLITM